MFTSAWKLSLFKQLTYMHLKVLITLFQKTICFTGVWATVHEVLPIKISKKMLTQQKINKISWLQTLISPKQLSHSKINNAILWKCVTRPFRWIYVNYINRLRLIAAISTKLWKIHLQIKDHNPFLRTHFFHPLSPL